MTFETFCELWENFSDPNHENFEDEGLGIVLLEWIRGERMKMETIISEM
jgi:hypothetical protein